MYLPAQTEETRLDEIHRVIKDHPFGILVTQAGGMLDANHVPFEFEPSNGGLGQLTAHVARANSIWQDLKSGDEVLVIFRGGDAYISPTWYPSKHELHRQVPTWNYQVVHAHGVITIQDDERFVRGMVARLTRTHEATAGNDKPWKMTDSAPEFIDTLLKAIVGIEIRVTALVAKSKLGKHKDVRDIEGPAEALKARHETEISCAMAQAAAQKKGAAA